MDSRVEKAAKLFTDGYNCCQSVFLAYADLYGLDFETAGRLCASFGGGMGRMREVCGAVSGMFMIAGLENGSADPKNKQAKINNYETVRKLSDEFKKISGSIYCRDILKLDKNLKETAIPNDRTNEYYKKRPCTQKVIDAANIIEKNLFSSLDK